MSDGVKKLTEYLNQTRRQAEMAIDVLNEKVNSLESENHYLKQQVDQAVLERDEFRTIAESLKNSKKHKFQERDDWKSLVDSIQTDRSRLQEENIQLSNALEFEREKSDHLEKEVDELNQRIEDLNSKLYMMSEELKALQTGSSDKENQTNGIHLPTNSEVEEDNIHTHINGSEFPQTPSKNKIEMLDMLSPRTAADAFKTELDHVTRKLKLERKLAQGEIQARSKEIEYLKQKLQHAQTNGHPISSSIRDGENYESNDAYMDTSWSSIVNYLFYGTSAPTSYHHSHPVTSSSSTTGSHNNRPVLHV